MATSVCAAATAAQASETTTYAYDALGRLVAVTSSGTVNNGIATSLGYDPAGNRSAYAVTGAGGGSPPPPRPPPPPPPPPSSNQPPVTASDSASIPRCGTVTKNVLADDTDSEGHYPLSLTAVSYGGALGSASIASSTSIFFEVKLLYAIALPRERDRRDRPDGRPDRVEEATIVGATYEVDDVSAGTAT